MKKQTVEAKLNALFGLTEKAEAVKVKATGRVVGVTEDEIQEFREAQGLIYFLQAPALFTHKICEHCKEPFLVSRKYVAFCSYTCIRESLLAEGITWRKGHDLEALAVDPEVYNGNEPLWIRYPNLITLKQALSTLLTLLESAESPLELSPHGPLPLGGSYSLEPTTTSKTAKSSRSSSARSTTSSTRLPEDLFPTVNSKSATPSQSLPKKKSVTRKFT